MLDWMKKLLKKEESDADDSVILEAEQYQAQKNNKKVVSDSYPNGKFRFPVIPDNRQVNRPAPIPFKERQAEPPKESQPQPMPVAKMIKPDPKPMQVRESSQNTVVFKPAQPKQESPSPKEKKEKQVNRGPFRLTETISPVFGYSRPNEDLWKKQPAPDLILSSESLSVVDAWLVKNGFLDAPLKAEEQEHIHIEEELFYEDENIKEELIGDEDSVVYEEFETPVLNEELCSEDRAETEQESIDFPKRDSVAEPEIVIEGVARIEEPFIISDVIAEENASIPEHISIQEDMAEDVIQDITIEEIEEQDSSYGEELTDEQTSSGENKEEAFEEETAYDDYAASVQMRNTPSEPADIQHVPPEQTEEYAEPFITADEREHKKQEAPRREKKRFVPYNVVMLKKDKLKMAGRQVKNAEPPQKATEPVEEQEPPLYAFPSLGLLSIPNAPASHDEEWLEEQKQLLDTTFENFHVGAKVIHVTQGPAVTRFEVQPEPGVKVNKITNLSDDIKLNLAARDIRIEAPIPGKNAVGIEVPNRTSKPVFLREILRSPVFTKSESPLTVALGLDISGMPIVTDIRKMPHGLIAGATGSGKSVCINAILTSILYKAMPHEVKLLLIDPKMVELAPYNEVPHLVSPVITDVKAATAALKWAVEEMERRYELFAHAGARDLTRYNDLVKQHAANGQQLPYIVIVIDELADLMMVSPADVEEAICRIAQKARACGIHLLVATQRPSVDVITGLIKANIPTRVAFTVSSQVDSRTIIDMSGAEKLLGRGDMLFLENGTGKPVRVQGVYVSDEEIERTVAHVKREMKPDYLFQQEDLLAKVEQHEAEDELFLEACQFVLDQGGASTSSLQRRFRIGYNRAARLMEEMEMQGIISEARGTKPRDILITEDELAAMQDNV